VYKQILKDRWFLLNYFWGFNKDEQNYKLKIVRAEVAKIKYVTRFPIEDAGPRAVVGVGHGNWDKFVKDFEKSYLYRSLKLHFQEGRPWPETPIYEIACGMIKRGGALLARQSFHRRTQPPL